MVGGGSDVTTENTATKDREENGPPLPLALLLGGAIRSFGAHFKLVVECFLKLWHICTCWPPYFANVWNQRV